MALAHRARRHASDAAKAGCLATEALGGPARASDSLNEASGEFLDDRAIWPIITTAGGDKVLERGAHGMQRSFMLAKVGYPRLCQRFDIRTGACPIGSQRQKLANRIDWKAKVAGAGDKLQSVNVTVRVIPILRVPSERLQADFPIVAHHSRAEPRRRRCLADIHEPPLDLDTMSTSKLRRDA